MFFTVTAFQQCTLCSFQNLKFLHTFTKIQFLMHKISLLQDGSTNSSPVFSSAENSFDKSKLVVRDLFSILQNLKCYPMVIRLNGNIFFKEHKIPILKYYWILLLDRSVCDGIPCSLILTEHQPVQSGRQLRPIRWLRVTIFTGPASAHATQR